MSTRKVPFLIHIAAIGVATNIINASAIWWDEDSDTRRRVHRQAISAAGLEDDLHAIEELFMRGPDDDFSREYLASILSRWVARITDGDCHGPLTKILILAPEYAEQIRNILFELEIWRINADLAAEREAERKANYYAALRQERHARWAAAEGKPVAAAEADIAAAEAEADEDTAAPPDDSRDG